MPMDLYHQQIFDLYKNPLSKGVLENPTWSRHEINPTCGDEVTVYCLVENGKVTNMTHQGHGCAISQASASLLTDEAAEKTLEELSMITPNHVVEMLGIELGPTRLKCALLPLQAITRGIAAWRRGQNEILQG